MELPYLSMHLHTSASIGDSIVTIDDLIKKAKELKLKHLAITNHGSVMDVYDFYIKCKEENIKPIIGCEFYVKDYFDEKKYNHLVLIAKNTEGFFNLISLHNKSQLEDFYKKPLVTDESLEQYGDNLIALSACVGGAIPQAILRGTRTEEESEILKEHNFIINTINKYKNYFDDFYLEVQPGDFEDQEISNLNIMHYAKETNTKVIITNDVHYINEEDYIAHNTHVVANRKGTIDKSIVYPDKCYFIMSNKQIKDAIKNDDLFNTSQTNIYNIIDSIQDYEIVPDNLYMPKYTKLPTNKTESGHLSDLCFKELDRLILNNELDDPSEYTERLIYELSVLDKLSFSGYFLVVMDYCMFADNNNIERGPGRGSVCGSLIAYLLKLTYVDPIRFNLLFERFLSQFRTSPPDIDTDFDSKDRHLVFEYIKDIYGDDYCALVSTLGNRKSKSALKDTGRAYGIDKEVYEYVAGLIPEVYYVDDDDGGTDKKTDLSITESMEIVPELKQYANDNKEWFRSAIKLSNLPKSTSIHAGGVLISPINLKETIPLIRSKAELNATSLTLDSAEKAGMIKYDILSVSTLGVVKKVKNMLKQKDIYSFIDNAYDDPKVWDLIGSKHTTGLFQIGTPTYKQRMGRLAPRTIEQLAACLALVRGPCIASKADQKYMDIVQGKDTVELIHPLYDNITKDTNGILLYQEQFMKLFVDIGFSMEDGYTGMKAAAKKKMDKLKKYEEKFIKLSKNFNMSEDVAKRIFKILVDTGLYSFNLSHAIAYAILTYITAYLKVYYPKEFLSASLTNAFERKESTKELIADCRRLGIKFLDLDINESKWDFTIEDNALRIGFCAVKSFSEGAYNEICRLRKDNPIKDINYIAENAAKKACGKTPMVPAIMTGAFDFYNSNRAEVYKEYCLAIGIKEEKIDPFILPQGAKSKISIHADKSELEMSYFDVTIHDDLNSFDFIDLDVIEINKPFKIKGKCDKIKKIKTKAGDEMCFITIKTGSGDIDITVFKEAFASNKKVLKKNSVFDFNIYKNKQEKYVLKELIKTA